MADYAQTPHRPNANPTGLPPTEPPIYQAEPSDWGMGTTLGVAAAVGIVALIAWSVVNNGPSETQGQTTPAATQTAPDRRLPHLRVTPDATATPEPTTPEPIAEPEPVPQEIPQPAPEAPPVPAPTPAPPPTY